MAGGGGEGTAKETMEPLEGTGGLQKAARDRLEGAVRERGGQIERENEGELCRQAQGIFMMYARFTSGQEACVRFCGGAVMCSES